MNKIQTSTYLVASLVLSSLVIGGCTHAVTESAASNRMGSTTVTEVTKPQGDSRPASTSLKVDPKPEPAMAANSNTNSQSEPTKDGVLANPPAGTPQNPSHSDRSGQLVRVAESGTTKDLTCNGEDIAVGGSENKIIVRGRVGKVEVAGSTNDIQIENASMITINGVENRIRWSGSQPKIVDNGMENQVRNTKEAAVARRNELPPAPKTIEHQSSEPLPTPVPTTKVAQ